ncbi:PTS fructose transporter subunit IIC [Telmatospirillum siberiense]|uniref:protein-N(pi)-phosphohistidine--D-fructose phosphotransferase n=1 Tax=Telmatospirillum siberiense TaxID=382514 RepID=A0A2N3PXD3_9PROT|nr:fructose-specific PTS transporter subunit EIIC [Telmatospirillum siberiense]PKU25070.1 PTS fructose transporter subunit EIIBC [Telmatospirillum siberiense]
MTDLVASITAGDVTVAGVLAAEALKSAAASRRRSIEIEVRTAEGVLNPLGQTQISGAKALLLIGPGKADDPRFSGIPQVTATVGDVLADAGAVLDRVGEGAGGTDAPARKIVAITSCPTGIAHTFMAAEGITQAAAALGFVVRVETQGSVGAQNTLTDAEIAEADVVLIAADKQVELSRFAGKRVFQSGTKAAINDGKALINRALAEAALQEGSTAKKAAGGSAAGKVGPYKHLMTGVSFMLPFITAGGLLIALAFALGGIYAYDPAQSSPLAYALFQIGGKSAFVLIVPALAGYIAFSIADRPGIAPGMIGGMLASNLGAGFLGGIAAGFIAGYGTAWFNRHIKLHRNLEGLKPVLILPLLGSLLTGLLMIFLVGTPVANLLAFLTEWLKGMQGTSAVLLGLLIGGMMAFDMGGPVNKAAYAFSTGLLASQIYTPMAAAMAAGMTPPLALALATRLFPGRFTHDEREASGAAGILGLAFITEGAIPFAARDPFRVIPANMAGSAVAGAISMVVGVELKVPHGGVFVLPIPNAVTHLGLYVVALAAGTAVSALALGLLKKPIQDGVV